MINACPVLAMALAAQVGGEGGGEARPLAAAFFASGTVLAIAAAVFACGLALQLVTVLLVPGITQRGADRVQQSPYRALGVGVAALVILILLAKAAGRAQGLVVIVLPAGVLLLLGGLAAIAQDLGRRIFALAGRSGSRLGRILAGWALFLLAAATPYLGWFVVGPILLALGIGGFLLSLLARPAGGKAAAETPVAAPTGAPAGGGTGA